MDNAVAFDIFGLFIYWHGLIIALASAAALITAVLLHKSQGGSAKNVCITAAAGFIPAFILGRLYYCHFAQTSFADRADMLRLGKGGIALYGVAAGYVLTALIYCLITKNSFAKLADAATPACALGIAIGRCASLFSSDDIGRSVTVEGLQCFPFAVYSEKYGEWRTAVFVFEAAAALVILAVLLVPFFKKYIRGSADRINDGDIALLFLLFYGVTQTVFESMRSDSMLLISLGFVRAAQVISIVLATIVFVIFSIRSARKGITWKHWTGWALSVCAIALAFWMEFCITSANATRNYIVMSICLLFYTFTAVALYVDCVSEKAEQQPAAVHALETPQPAGEPAVEEPAPVENEIETAGQVVTETADDVPAETEAAVEQPENGIMPEEAIYEVPCEIPEQPPESDM